MVFSKLAKQDESAALLWETEYLMYLLTKIKDGEITSLRSGLLR